MAEDREPARADGAVDPRRPRTADADVQRYRAERERARPAAGLVDRVARPGAARGYDTK